MNKYRYRELSEGVIGEFLTTDEKQEGWHFCPEWDFLLIHPCNPEAESCNCKTGVTC